MDVIINLYGHELRLEVDYEPGAPGCFGGAWEDSEPDVPARIEVLRVFQGDQDISWMLELLPESVVNKIYALAYASASVPEERDAA